MRGKKPAAYFKPVELLCVPITVLIPLTPGGAEMQVTGDDANWAKVTGGEQTKSKLV